VSGYITVRVFDSADAAVDLSVGRIPFISWVRPRTNGSCNECLPNSRPANGQPFTDALADDARWTVIGSSPWSRTYEGKRAITDELMRPLFRQFADRYKARAIRVVAEGDVVVVEARGEVTTRSGKPYNQRYCYVFRLAHGEVRELTEYLDTDLVKQVLEMPANG
jgi:uncharacterized protein